MVWSRLTNQRRYASIEGMDPAAQWLLDYAFSEFQPDGEDAPFPFIIRIDDQAGVDVLNARRAGPLPFLLPHFDRGPRRPIQVGEYVTMFASRRFFDDLADENPDSPLRPLRIAPKQIQLSLPLAQSAASLTWRPNQPRPEWGPPPLDPNFVDWPPETVVIGIIDDGIGFAHERFRTAGNQSRVEFFWHQDGVNAAPSSVMYGREFGKADIDRLIADNPTSDEAIYREAGMLDFTQEQHKPIARRAAHGTHVLDIYAGANPADAPPNNRPIIAVQLATAATEFAYGAGLETQVKDAINYIRDRARLLARNGRALPVVINFSYAVNTGPHDGTAPLEVKIDEAIAADDPPLRVVVPAGNGNATRCHAEVCFDAQPRVELPWRVLPDDRTSSTMQIWMPHDGLAPPRPSRVALSVVTPDGMVSPQLGEQDGWFMVWVEGGEVVGYVGYDFISAPTERGLYTLWLRPTARLASPGPLIPVARHGVWTVRLDNLQSPRGEQLHAWIGRDERIFGYPRRGRQSFFDAECYERFDAQGRRLDEDGLPCMVRRAHMINGIGTGKSVFVAGGFVWKQGEIAHYSAGGPITPPGGGALPAGLFKPDAVLLSDDTRVHAGVLAAGSRSGTRLAMNGTSIAAPRLARWIANRMAAGLPAHRADVAAEAALQNPAPPNPPLNPDRLGAGRIRNFDPPHGLGWRYRL